MSIEWNKAVKLYKENNPDKHIGRVKKGTPEYDEIHKIFKGGEVPRSPLLPKVKKASKELPSKSLPSKEVDSKEFTKKEMMEAMDYIINKRKA